MSENYRPVGFDVNGALANSKTNLISLLQPYQQTHNQSRTSTSSTSHKNNSTREVCNSDEGDEIDDDDGDDLSSLLKNDTLEPKVQKEIDRIYANRRSSPPDNNTNSILPSYQYDLNSLSRSPTNGEQNDGKDIAIPRAYVRPTHQPLAVPEPVLSELETMKANLAPPLPLMRFSATDEKEIAAAHTITGEKLRTIPNLIGPSPVKKSTPLCDPIYSRKISKWFIKRSFKESNLRQVESYSNHIGCSTAGAGAIGDDQTYKPEVLEHIVYESLLYAENISDRRTRDAQRVPEEHIFQERYERILAQNNNNCTAANSTGATPAISRSSSNKDIANLSASAPGLTPASVLHPGFTPSLKFDGEFESGNLEKAVRVIGRESLLSARTLEQIHDFACPGEVDQEYDLTLRKDVNTDGNIQWYYFGVTAGEPSDGVDARLREGGDSNSSSAASSSRPTPMNTSRLNHPPFNSRAPTPLSGSQTPGGGRSTPVTVPSIASLGAVTPVKYPLRVRFNIVNMQKKDSLYNYGMLPATYSVNQVHGEDWVHRGEDVCYYRNGATTIKPNKKKMLLQYHYTLTFTYTFDSPDTVYFAHTFPYTYSDLQLSLCKMEQSYRNSGFFHQRTLCETLAGNSCDVLSISERSAGIIESKNKPAIVLTARVHPGESNSSFMIQGFLDFITSDAPEAIKLRQSFVFHIIPMLNPDGVIHGNYRCSLAATDLNRRYAAPHPKLHPTILAKKNFLKSTAQNRSILLYLDLHGHSKLKNAFLYGCDITLQNDKITKQLIPHMSPEDVMQRRVFSRVFPRVLSAVSNSTQDGYFSFRDCSYGVNKGKSGTGRVVCWREINILGAYTIEASFCGNGDNKEGALFKKTVEGGNGVGNNAKSTIAHPPGIRKSISSSALPRPRQDSGTGLGMISSSSTGGIAYFGGVTQQQKHAAAVNSLEANGSGVGNVEEGEGDKTTEFLKHNQNTLESPSGKSNTKKVLKKEKERSKPSQRRGSVLSTPSSNETDKKASKAEIEPEHTFAPVLEMDTALNDLLHRYQHNYIHYRKQDLLNMGRDIGIAIYHFANLSHSNIENELNIATRADAEARARAQRLSTINGYDGAVPRSSKSSRIDSPDLSSPSGKFRKRAKSTRIDAAVESNEDPHKGHLQSAAWCGNVWSGSGEDDVGMLYPGVDIANGDYDGLDAALKRVNEDETGAEGLGEGNADEAELDLEGDDSEESGEELSYDSEAASEDCTGSRPVISPLKGGALDIAALVKEYTSSKVRLLEYDMAQRSLLKAGVFSSAALEAAMNEYPSEFLDESSSYNVGMRMKCEYNIRRGLRCAGDIKLTSETLLRHEATFSPPFEEDNVSTDGSDSNPSVDNVPAAKMLRNIKKFKNNTGLVLALRKAAILKRKKELEVDRKMKKKEARRLAKQAMEAKRALDEARAGQAAKEAKDAAALAAQHQAAASAAVQQIAENLKEKVSRRKSSIFQSAPKHAPLYRFAPDEAKPAPQPLPMKVVNFKDYDAPEDGGPPVGTRSRKGSESNYETHSAHALALSMSTLTSAVNKLYFNNALEEVAEPGPIPTSIFVNGPPLNHHPLRRISLHNSVSNPNLFPSVINTAAEAPVPTPLLTATSLRREGSPRSASTPALPVHPTVHSMTSLVPTGPAEPLLRVRERPVVGTQEEDYGQRVYTNDRPAVGRVRPKSGSATSSARRKIVQS